MGLQSINKLQNLLPFQPLLDLARRRPRLNPLGRPALARCLGKETPNSHSNSQNMSGFIFELYNIFQTQNMDIVNLQSQILRALFEMGNRQNDFSQLNRLVQNVWGQPEMLNDSFRIYCNKLADFESHNVDLPFLVGFYQDMLQNITDFPNGFLPIYEQIFKAFPTEAEVHAFVKQANSYSKLRVFLILLFWPPLFEGQIKQSNLLGFLKMIRALYPEHKECLSHWLADMESQRFYQTVNFLHNALSNEIVKLLPGQFDKHDPMQVSETLMLLCEGLALFSRSNRISKRIESEHFRNYDVMKYFNHGDQFNLHIRRIKLLNFIEYPFLLDLPYKDRLLEIENHYEHQLTIERALLDLLNGRFANNEQVVIDQATIKSLYLQLQINRHRVLEDSIEQIMNTTLSLKNPLKISFVGEPGDDAGGVKKEYFQLLVKSIFNESSDMFTTINNNAYYWFNGQSYETTVMFEFIGIVLGLSIYNNTLLDVKFPRLIYKKLIEPDNKKLDCFEELAQIDPDLYRGLKYILETEQPLEQMELTFQASVIHFGQRVNFDLKPCGSMISVTQTNKHEYVNRLACWTINDYIEKQFEAFKKGFYRVVTGDMIKLFSAEELEKIICGSSIIDIKELRRGARYGGGYKPDTPIIHQFWEILHQLNQDQMKAFLFFATGSDRTPVGGLSSLKFIVERHTSDSQMLPSSRTCSNLLLLPEYSSKEKLKQKLLLAIQHKEGFGLI